MELSKPLLALFLEHVHISKKEFRQRRALTVLQNVRATKIKENHLRNSELNHKVTVGQLKPQDKKKMLRNFFSDDRVQILVSKILIKHAGIQVPGIAQPMHMA